MLGGSHNFKSERLRKKRRKAVIGKLVFAFFCLADLWLGLFLFSGISAVTVKNIEVAGLNSVSSADVDNIVQKFLTGRYFFTISRSNIFFYPRIQIERSIIQAFPQIESVVVGPKSLEAIFVKITERQAAALWCNQAAEPAAGSAACYLLDGNGLIFAPYSELASSSPYFIKFYSAAPKANPIGQSYLPAEFFRSLLGFAKNLGALGFEVSFFSERADSDFEARLSGGQRLIFSRNDDLASVLSNLEAIISDPGWSGTDNFKKVDYMDTRFGNKVFYKFK